MVISEPDSGWAAALLPWMSVAAAGAAATLTLYAVWRRRRVQHRQQIAHAYDEGRIAGTIAGARAYARGYGRAAPGRAAD